LAAVTGTSLNAEEPLAA